MLDAPIRARLEPLTDLVARRLVRLGIPPLVLTTLGLVLALAAAGAAALALWPLAAGLWLVSRIPDGLDGPVARASGRDDEFGGWADISADIASYGVFVVGCAVGRPDAALALMVLLLTYYINGSTLLAYSAAAERARLPAPDGRTFHFTRGLAEGTETIAAHTLLVLFPAWMVPIALVFAAMVMITTLHRVVVARTALRPAGGWSTSTSEAPQPEKGTAERLELGEVRS